MATHDVNSQDEARRGCFLCSLDPKSPCNESQLEGRIVAAQERTIDGTKISIVLIDTGTRRVELHFADPYYRSLVRELKALGDVVGSYNLTLRVYHLPHAPSIHTIRGKERHCYHANAYTLAVLEPDILLNITDLNMAEYCPRQYMLNRLSPSVMSPATIRGNLVHHCFKELLKEHNKGNINIHQADAIGTTGRADVVDVSESPLAILHRHLEQALHFNAIEMALVNISPDAMRTDVLPHLESLARWYERESATLWDMPSAYADDQNRDAQGGNQVRAETFLLAPEIGLRGRLDLFWQQSGRQRLLELKTGGASGDLPRREHRWQVYGYHALLTVRRDSKMKRALATLLYSGTPGSAQAFGIPATIREIQRVNETRNRLLLSRVTSIAPAPPGPSRCTKCAMLKQCQHVSSLLQWQPPEPDPGPISANDAPAAEARANSASARLTASDEERTFFAHYYHLLQIEGRTGEQQQALLWKTPVTQRIEQGTAISGLRPQGAPREVKDGWEQTFYCLNTSELREGDEILLSNGDPITGEVVTGTIIAISSEQVTVWTREIIAYPTLIDRYDNDLVHVRTLQNLLRWLDTEPHLRDLIAGRIRPRFIARSHHRRADFNAEQNLAVERALEMQDYLLIHGPPGTGKTSVIAEIVKQLSLQGQRIMLAAFTNQAVDNMLKRLEKDGFHDYLRLGSERSTDDAIKHRHFRQLIGVLDSSQTQEHAATALPVSHSEGIRELLQTAPVIATTTATWSSDKYIPQAENLEEMGLHFDVAIIDEAGQLTIPAILGALRFARRFILVGDEKQLPPLVLSKEAAQRGLADSLFSTLKRLDNDYMNDHPLEISACVSLRTQYRMNRWISHFSSTVFYEKLLVAHESVAHRKLALSQHPSFQKYPEHIQKALDPAFPLVFLDVHDELAEVGGKISIAEARTVRDIVAELLARGIAQQDIGIIAPYRAQVATIRRHLFSHAPESGWQALPVDSPLSVDTVDRFQGGERMVIILSFATTQEPETGSQRREFLVNPNRLNVALTRAQRKLILVGSAPALEHLPIFSRLITYCRSMNTLVSCQLPQATIR
ncbi:MAG TPA: AAA domain-containing protein [Ktedonosporobacter sp.]|jgi:DNA replication ATP-dependent helicase Dna2|nr:AAA domain-containing protein [Ktedonosporobacter sp.]